MAKKLPDPPDLTNVEPLTRALDPGTSIYRIHSLRFHATGFNPGLGRGRFHPFADRRGRQVPTMYGSSSLDGALSETVFHSVPVRGRNRAIRRSTLRHLALSIVTPERALTLVRLHGHGLRRLRVTRRELIETEADEYPNTIRWASALHRADAQFDGLEWVSRQHDTSRALVLFGDRVTEAELTRTDGPIPLGWAHGFQEVQRAAEEAQILIIE
jgi:RES domain